jgi:hypothetical protein
MGRFEAVVAPTAEKSGRVEEARRRARRARSPSRSAFTAVHALGLAAID